MLCYTQASRLSNSQLGIFPITLAFSSPCSRSTILAYISLIRSFFCHVISQTLRSHHTTLILSLSPHSFFYTNIMYFHSSMVTTTTSLTIKFVLAYIYILLKLLSYQDIILIHIMCYYMYC